MAETTPPATRRRAITAAGLVLLAAIGWRLWPASTPPVPPPAAEATAPSSEPSRILARWDRPPSASPRAGPERAAQLGGPEVQIIGEPPSVEGQLAAHSREEALGYLGGIRVALIAYEAAFGEIPVPTGPCPAHEPGLGGVRWEGECTAFFRTIGWSPSEEAVRCSYEVEEVPVDSGAAVDLAVTALCDGDGDGELAEYEISLEQPQAVPVTDPSVY